MKVSIDRKILTAFQRDGHLTHQQLSEQVGLSPTPCARRIKRLETDGIITGYGARINAAKQGFDVSVFVSVRLDQQVDTGCGTSKAMYVCFPRLWTAG
ncbi:Lrp/AsnC family transcriptional regulator [Cognatiyoonia sp.]|uniref:Lrp/AsnC family transcriptional regulator n=1 Tax=Cognatiyoonia sp. TaxID=2211652 RepID=UPI003F696BF6